MRRFPPAPVGARRVLRGGVHRDGVDGHRERVVGDLRPKRREPCDSCGDSPRSFGDTLCRTCRAEVDREYAELLR